MTTRKQDLGAIPGSRERGQEVVPALTGFDPARIDELLDRMRGLSSALGAGLAESVSDPFRLLDRIEWGIDLIQQVETARAADIVEEMSKLPVSWGKERITWGKIKSAILARVAVDPARYQLRDFDLYPRRTFPNGSSAIAMEAATAGETCNRLDPKDDSAGRRHRPKDIG